MIGHRLTTGLWNLYAHMYDGLLDFWPYRDLLDRVEAELQLTTATAVLDLGCGTGNLTQRLALRGARVDAVDGSHAMIAIANRKLASFVSEGAVRLYHEDLIQHLRGCPTSSVDRVVMTNVLYALSASQRAELWHAILRVLRPDGRAVITTSDRPGSLPIIRDHLRHAGVRDLLTARLAGVFVVDAIINLLARSRQFQLTAADVLTAEIAKAGGRLMSIQRCYGGDVDGVNILVVLTHGSGTATRPDDGETGDHLMSADHASVTDQ